MKKVLLTAMVMAAFFFSTETKAQVRIGLNVNIGTRPSWGLPGNPAGDYYYMPEINTYYDIPHRQFIYYQGNDWVFASELPSAYRSYDLNRGYKVAINANRPYLHNDVYRTKYISYYNNYHRSAVVHQRPGVVNHSRNNNGNHGRPNEHFKGRGAQHNDHNDHNNRGHDNGHDKKPHGRG